MKNLARKANIKSVAVMLGCSLICQLNTRAQEKNPPMQEEKMTGNTEMEQLFYKAPQKPEDISPLLYGEKIPIATLQDASGQEFDLNMAVSVKPTVLVFYRGGWCPYCSKQLSGLQEVAPELEKLGYQLIAVSTDSPERLMQSVTKEKLNYTLLSDAGLLLSRQFGIAYKAPEGYWEMLPETTGGKDVDLLLPVPSVFILDKEGIIHFEYINPDFTTRLSPDLLRAAASSIRKDL